MFKTAHALVAVLGILFACAPPPDESGAVLDNAGLEAIDADSLMDRIVYLSSDELEGRAPGTEGEEKTVEYLTSELQKLGLAPGDPNGTYTQDVPLVGISADRDMTLTLRRDDRERILEPGQDFVAWTKRVVDEVTLDGDMVFVGYGVVAPEYDWNDFKDVDVEGKVLVVLVNDPPIEDAFGGEAMTYYGRWTYKYTVAAERGAAGVFVVHETGPAGYPWEVVEGSWTGEQFDLVSPDKNMDRAAVEGWLTFEQAQALFEMAGLDFEAQKQAAADRAFTPVPLNVRAQTHIENSLRTIESQNVLAKLEGGEAGDELVIYTAHWDHLGKDPERSGDQIFNGAKDNASGTAGLLEIAEAFTRLEEPPRRSVLFLSVTAEEQGLLGSRYYAENPLYPPEKTVAVINMDGLNVYGRTRDLTVIGMGQSELDQLAAEIAEAQGRALRPDPEPEKGFYYRSDHFEFAKIGIPAFDPDEGVEYVDKPEGYGMEIRQRYTTEDYHKPSDEVKEYWDLSGAVEDLELFYLMGHRLATSSLWPEWSPESEFRATRREMMESSAPE